MIILFKYFVNVENCESFKDFGYIYIYIYKEIMLSDTNKGLGVLSTSIAKLLLDIKLWVVYSVDNK